MKTRDNMWPHEALVEMMVLIVSMWYRVDHMWEMFHIVITSAPHVTHIIPRKCSKDTFPVWKVRLTRAKTHGHVVTCDYMDFTCGFAREHVFFCNGSAVVEEQP